MGDELDGSGSEPVLDDGGSVDRSVVPVEKPLPADHLLSFFVERSHEGVEGSQDVVGVDSGAPGYDVPVDQPLAVEERQDHLLCSTGMD